MQQILLYCHSIVRWVVIFALFYSIYRSWKGYISNSVFSKHDNAVRHWTATISHVQLMIGIILFVNSPVVSYFWSNVNVAAKDLDSLFFGLIHIVLMTIAIVLITVGSALAKREKIDKRKFQTMLIWYAIATLIIIIAIPWPFSPLASRPYLR